MLTKNDLQQIKTVVGEVIQEETPKIVKKELAAAIDTQIRPIIREEITGAIDTQIRPIVKEEITTALKPVKKKLNTLHKDFHAFVDHFDTRLTKVESDVKVLQNNYV